MEQMKETADEKCKAIENCLNYLFYNNEKTIFKEISKICISLSDDKDDIIKRIKFLLKNLLRIHLEPFNAHLDAYSSKSLNPQEIYNSDPIISENTLKSPEFSEAFLIIQKINNLSDFLNKTALNLKKIFMPLGEKIYFMDKKMFCLEKTIKRELYLILKRKFPILLNALSIVMVFVNIIAKRVAEIDDSNINPKEKELFELIHKEISKIIKTYREYGLKIQLLNQLKDSLVKQDFEICSKSPENLKFISSYFSFRYNIFNQKFCREIESEALKQLFNSNNKNVLIEKLSNLEDLRLMFGLFQRAKLLNILLDCYKIFINFEHCSNYIIELFKVYLKSKVISSFFTDSCFDEEFSAYFSNILDSSKISENVSEWIDSFFLLKPLLIKQAEEFIGLIENAYKIHKHEILCVRLRKANEESSQSESNSASALENVYETKFNRFRNPYKKEISEENELIYNDEYSIKRFKAEKTNLIESFIRSSIFKMIALLTKLNKNPENFFKQIQLKLAYRIFNNIADIELEGQFIDQLVGTYSEIMMAMLRDFKLAKENGFTDKDRNGILLMKMCKWPLFMTEDVILQEFEEKKKEIENENKDKKRRVMWIDSLGKAYASIFGNEISFSIFQYSILKKFNEEESLLQGIPVSVFNVPKCYKTQFNLLLEGKLLVQNGDRYFINSNFDKNFDFIPSKYELYIKKDEVECTHEIDDKTNYFEAKIMKILKKEKKLSKKELLSLIGEEFNDFERILSSLSQKGFLEIEEDNLIYSP